MKIDQFIGIIVLVLLSASCANAYYQVDTQVHNDGTISRDVYTWGDSAFMVGDMTQNPFLFPLNDWSLEKPDSTRTLNYWGENKRWNVKASKQVSSIEQFSAHESTGNSLATPRESLQKKFRWFYTYYIYTNTFSEIADKGPVSIDRYLTKQEQALWFQGDMSSYPDLNGVEMKEVLDKLEDKFWKWYRCSLFEVSYSVFLVMERTSAEERFTARLIAAKDSIYALHKEEEDFTPEKLSTCFDDYFHTDYFSKLYQKEKDSFEMLFDDKCRTARLFEYVIKYRMSMPGKLLSANTGYLEEGALVWKVNAFRLMAGDYTLKAESRVCNTWAFVVTLLLMVVAVGGLWKVYRKS